MFVRRMIVTTVCAIIIPAAAGSASAVDSYQVTGQVAEVSATKIVVMKDKERFEIERDASSKLIGAEPKIGSKVMVKYAMTAKGIENKDPASTPPPAPPAKAASTPAKPAKSK